MDVKITDNSDKFKSAMSKAKMAALEAIGLQAEGYAKKLCPVDTGNLRNSITHETDENEQAAYIGTNVEYAAHVEMGTSKMGAQPYLKPAAADHSSEYKSIIENEMRKG